MPNLVCEYWIDLEMAESHIPFLGDCDLDLNDLLSRIIVS